MSTKPQAEAAGVADPRGNDANAATKTDDTDDQQQVEENTESDSDQQPSAAAADGKANARRPIAFQPTHALKFGLEVVAREQTPSGPRVTAALCLFCKHFGREAKVGAKRRATTNFKYFKGVFRTDQYLQHHRLQHPIKWAEYDAASVREKQSFFPRYVMPPEALVEATADGRVQRVAKAKKRRADGESDEVNAAVDGDEARVSAVEMAGREAGVFIRGMENIEVRDAIVRLFLGDREWKPPALTVEKREGDAVYAVNIPDPLALSVAADLCATGLSIQQTTDTMHAMAKYVAGGASISTVWGALVQSYVQVATFASVDTLSKLLAPCWAFSLGFHRVADDRVQLRVRFLSDKLQDLHLLELPISRAASDAVVQVLDLVHPSWAKSLVSVSVAGDVFASTPVIATVKQLRARASDQGSDVLLTWHGAELLEHALQQLFYGLLGGSFAETWQRLRWQIKSESKLIQEIGHEPAASTMLHTQSADRPSLPEIFSTTRWLTEKRMRIRRYFEENSKPPPCSDAWWLCLAAFDWIGTHADSFVASAKGVPTSQASREHITLLADMVLDMNAAFQFQSVATTADTALASSVCHYKTPHGTYFATKTGVLEFVMDLGSFANSLLASFKENELDTVLESLGRGVATFVETIDTGIAHAELYLADVDALTSYPLPILPHDLAKLSGKDFASLVASYRSVLAATLSEEQLDGMEQEHLALKRAMREKDFRSEIASTGISSFDAPWARTLGRFRQLHAFAGGLATLLPSGQQPRQPRQLHGDQGAETELSLLDFAVEAPRHAAQFAHLHALRL